MVMIQESSVRVARRSYTTSARLHGRSEEAAQREVTVQRRSYLGSRDS